MGTNLEEDINLVVDISLVGTIRVDTKLEVEYDAIKEDNLMVDILKVGTIKEDNLVVDIPEEDITMDIAVANIALRDNKIQLVVASNNLVGVIDKPEVVLNILDISLADPT